MTRVERRMAMRTGLLGAALSLLVVVIAYSDLLAALERWCYDHRARYCQFYTPPPSEQFVHIDIDDQTLTAVGHWPWTGTVLAELLDEICQSKPKIVTFDAFFPERQRAEPVTATRPDGSEIVTGRTDHNANFAESIARCGNVIMPASLGKPDPPLPLQEDVTKILAGDLESSEAEVIAQLAKRGKSGANVAREVAACFTDALKFAMFQRVSAESSAGSAVELAPKLLPKHTDQYSALRHDLDEALLQRHALSQLHRFARTDVTVPLFPVQREIASLPEIMAAAKGTAFVDYVTSSDGKVRSVPLWVAVGKNAYPQMGLAAACAMLDLDPRDPHRVIIATDSVALLPPNRDRISIPLRAGMMDIPWRGPSDWEHMYDDAKSPHHVIMRDVYQIVLTRRAQVENVVQLDDAILAIMQQLGDARLDDFKAHPPVKTDVTSRTKLIADLQKQMKDDPILPSYFGKNPTDFTDSKEQTLVASIGALQHFADLDTQVQRQRDSLAKVIAGKAVFIGATATAMSDFVPTSLHARCPGVVIHGTIFNGIMTGELWRTASPWTTLAITFAMGLFTTLACSMLSPFKSTLAALAILAAYIFVNGIVLFDARNIIVGLAGPIVAVAAVWAGCTLLRLLIEGYERAVVTRRFRTYVDPNLVNYFLEHPEKANFGGELREVTVVYTDLAGFTTISQRLGEKVVPILNDYFDQMVPIIEAHHGVLNKFLGDGIMFFFGSPYDAPNHAAQAVASILDMQKVMPAFNERLKQQGFPPLIVRAGVSTGLMVVGDAGSKARSDYTVLGDCSNLGARLESANKALGTSNLLSVRTVELMGDGFLVRPIGRLIVVGRDSYIMTYEAFCKKDEATDRHRRLVAMTETMVHAYLEGRFHQCLEAIEQMESEFGPDKLTDLYREWAQKHLKGVHAEEFVGQIVLESK